MAYLPILTYHRVLPDSTNASIDPQRIAVRVSQFRQHMTALKKWGYQPVGLADYANDLVAGRLERASALRDAPSGWSPSAGRLPVKKQCAISFDDGYDDVLTLALPILRELGFTATVFAVAGQLGGTNAWDSGQSRLLSQDQFRSLRKQGITIGAHTANHVHLPQVTSDIAKREIEESKKRLEEFLQEPVTTFAYPYGESTPAIENQVREAGFQAAFATDRAPANHAENRYRIRRVVIFPRTTLWELGWKLQRWYPAYQDGVRRLRS